MTTKSFHRPALLILSEFMVLFGGLAAVGKRWVLNIGK